MNTDPLQRRFDTGTCPVQSVFMGSGFSGYALAPE
jgi:hypothetical protein